MKKLSEIKIIEDSRNKIQDMIMDYILYIDSCLSKKTIPLDDISPKILKELGLLNDEGL